MRVGRQGCSTNVSVSFVGDAAALEQALHRVLTEPHVAARMAAEAARLAPSMAWPVDARSYLALADRLLATRAALV